MEKTWSVVAILLYYLTFDRICVESGATNNGRFVPNCLFPSYLQTDCNKPHSICQWSQGKRFTSREFASSTRWWGYRGHGEWNWVINKGIAKAVSSPELENSGESGERIYSCLKSMGGSTFLVSYKDSRNEDAASFTCIQFVRRGLNVVQYKISSFETNPNNTRCDNKSLITNNDPLVANVYMELPDCPKVLQGGYKIIKIYNRLNDLTCSFDGSLSAILESDCLAKEGLYIDLGASSNCSRDTLLRYNIYDVNFRCYSRPWTYNGFTFFITARRPRWRNEYESFEFQCIIFEEGDFKTLGNSSRATFKLYIFNSPQCPQVAPIKSKGGLGQANFILYLEKFSNISIVNSEPGCTFPEELTGKWIEKSTQLGIQEINIEQSAITFTPYGQFICRQRYIFNRENPHQCVNSGSGGQWLGEGRVRFYFDDFILSSSFSNGCRQRVTRLGLTETLRDKMLVYRLSQSEPVKNSWLTPEEYQLLLLKRFCSALYIFEKDPYPFWGRNIEKILLKAPLTGLSKTKCSLRNERDIMYNFRAVYNDPKQRACSDEKSWIEIGCETNEDENSKQSSASKISVRYGNNCTQEEVSYDCLGKLRMFGEFSLMQDTRKNAIYCAYYDSETRQIFRMNSSQCSDLDWGVGYGKRSNFYERFDLKYPSRCPVRTNSDNHSRNTRVPPKKQPNGAGRNGNFEVIVYFITFLIVKLCSENLRYDFSL